MDDSTTVQQRLIALRNCVAWHNAAIDEHERCGRSFESTRHRRVVGTLLDQIDALEAGRDTSAIDR